MLNLWALLMAWGGITMAVASAGRRRSASASGVAIAALVAALVDYLARAWAPIRPIAWLSPFHYYSPLDIVMGAPLPLTNVATLLGITAVGVAVAFVVFLRRDL
jgi:ABC-2 type transport system permease protein